MKQPVDVGAEEDKLLKLRKLLLVGAIIIAVALFLYSGLKRYLSLDQLKSHRVQLTVFYQAHPVGTVLAYVFIYVVQTALSLPGAAILSLAAGAIFGVVQGTSYAIIAATIGATLAFLGSRYLFREAVVARFGGRLEGINRELEEQGGNYLLFLRLVPLFPFFLVNIAAGITRLPLRTFVITTAIGIIPGGLAYCNAGASIASIHSLRDVVSWRVLGSGVFLGLIAILPVFYTRRKKRLDDATDHKRS